MLERSELGDAARGGGLGVGPSRGAHGLCAGDEGSSARGLHAAVDVAYAAELVEDVRQDEVCEEQGEERIAGTESGPKKRTGGEGA